MKKLYLALGGALFSVAVFGFACTSKSGKGPDAVTGNGGKNGSTGTTGDGSTTGTPVDFDPDSSANSGRWSDEETWPDSRFPQEGDDVLIPAGATVTLDITPPDLANVVVEGTLVFLDETDLELKANNIMVHGTLEIGTEDDRFEHQATITLTATDPNESFMGMGTRGLQIMGGTLRMHGKEISPAWTQLDAEAAEGATSLTLLEDTNWGAGDLLAIAPTDYYNVGRTEVAEVDSTDDRTVNLKSGLTQFHWGTLQYLTDDGVSDSRPSSGIDVEIDQRAEVANLSRNIVIQGPDDDLWREEGFGAQVMFMEGAQAYLDGIEVRRGGQAGRLGRYPLHFHILSYANDGSRLDNLTGQYVKNSAIWDSSQRCLVIHATNGLLIENNVCYDIPGHAFFLEDGVERENVFRKNLALHIHVPPEGVRLREHERLGFRRGPAGYWLTHPDNELYDNVVADSEGVGFWLAYGETPLGPSTNVGTVPRHAKFGVFRGGVAHSNQGHGFVFDFAPIDDLGTTVEMRYKQTADEQPNSPAVPFAIEGLHIYKHYREGTGGEPTAATGGPLWNRSHLSTYTGFVVSDFTGIAVTGGSFDCTITKNTIVGTTLNNRNRPPDENPALGAASYHSLCDISENIFAELPHVPDRASGAFATDDYYVEPVDKGLIRNSDNTFINAHSGYRVASPNITGQDNYSLAGALWDPYGFWPGSDPNKDYRGSYWVYDLPYLTEGTDCEPTDQPNNGMTCRGPYYGMKLPIFDGAPDDRLELIYSRVDTNPATEWRIGPGAEARRLPNMRHAAAVLDGEYRLSSPGISPTRSVSITINNLMESTDHFVLGLPYAANSAPGIVVVNGSGVGISALASFSQWKAGNENWSTGPGVEFWQVLEPADSLDEVRSSAGTKYFFDAAEDIVWIDCLGGIVDVNTGTATEGASNSESDIALYRTVEYLVSADIP